MWHRRAGCLPCQPSHHAPVVTDYSAWSGSLSGGVSPAPYSAGSARQPEGEPCIHAAQEQSAQALSTHWGRDTDCRRDIALATPKDDKGQVKARDRESYTRIKLGVLDMAMGPSTSTILPACTECPSPRPVGLRPQPPTFPHCGIHSAPPIETPPFQSGLTLHWVKSPRSATSHPTGLDTHPAFPSLQLRGRIPIRQELWKHQHKHQSRQGWLLLQAPKSDAFLNPGAPVL